MLAVLPSGRNPERNAYRSQVSVIRVLGRDEAEQFLGT